MADNFEEHHTYHHPMTSAAGQLERVDFLRKRLWIANGGDDAPARTLNRSTGRNLDKESYRQYRDAALLEPYDAMEEPSPYRLACDIARNRWGEGATDHRIDALRHQIERAIATREKGLAGGTWNPPPITSGSSVDVVPLDKTRRNR